MSSDSRMRRGSASGRTDANMSDDLVRALRRDSETAPPVPVASTSYLSPPAEADQPAKRPPSPSRKGWRSAFRRDKSNESLRGEDSLGNSRVWPASFVRSLSESQSKSRSSKASAASPSTQPKTASSQSASEGLGMLGVDTLAPFQLGPLGNGVERSPELEVLSQDHLATGGMFSSSQPMTLSLSQASAESAGLIAAFDQSPVAPFTVPRSLSDSAGLDQRVQEPAFKSEREEEQILGAMHADHRLVEHHPSSSADFVIAIIGPRNVGKSTVVRRGLKKPALKPVTIIEDSQGHQATSLRTYFNMSGQARSIEVLEIDTPLLMPKSAPSDSAASKAVEWPQSLPLPDGIMTCYDATDRLGFEALPALLDLIYNRGFGCPLIVLACKSSPDGKRDAVDLATAAQRCNAWGAAIAPLDGGLEDRDKKCKSCFNWMVRRVMKNRGELKPSTLAEAAPASGSASSSMLQFKSFLDTSEDSTAPGTSGPLSPEGLQLDQKLSISGPSQDEYHSREVIVDKFMFGAVSGNDEKSITTFLTVYRRFARPYDVLASLIERFTFVSSRMKSDPLMARFAQMKLCSLLSTWLHSYPGDFTAPATYAMLKPFLDSLLPRGATYVAHYAVQLSPLVASIEGMHDPDVTWAIPDTELRSPDLTTSDLPPRRSETDDDSLSHDVDQPDDTVDLTQDSRSSLNAPSTFPSESARSSRGRPRSGSDAGTLTTVDSTDLARSTTSSGMRVGKPFEVNEILLHASNAVGDIEAEAIARQITRIAWDAFSEMTPRELIKHVLAPRDPKNFGAVMRDEDGPVSRAIDFFNYLADWSTTIVLAQAKAKHRARLVAKLIHIAIKLREMDNYDGLMAVLAGLNAQPLFRLNETFEMIWRAQPDNKFKNRFLSLNKLMSTTRSFAAYRLALQSARPGFLPYLGVHLQDLTALQEVKQDMKDGMVNWTKFQQMGQAAIVVADCSKSAPAIAPDRRIENLLMGVPVLSKESQYALSYEYQPRGTDAGSKSKLRQFVDKALT